MFSFKDVPLQVNGSAISITSVGGNLHNELIDVDTNVALFKAVMTNNQMLSHVGSFVAYLGGGDSEVCIAIVAQQL